MQYFKKRYVDRTWPGIPELYARLGNKKPKNTLVEGDKPLMYCTPGIKHDLKETLPFKI